MNLKRYPIRFGLWFANISLIAGMILLSFGGRLFGNAIDDLGFLFIPTFIVFAWFNVPVIIGDALILFTSALGYFVVGVFIGYLYEKFYAPHTIKAKLIIAGTVITTLLVGIMSFSYYIIPVDYDAYSPKDCGNNLYHLKMQFNIGQCYSEAAWREQDLSFCENLPLGQSGDTYNRYYCYGQVAMKKADYDICNEIPEQSFKREKSECILKVEYALGKIQQ